MTPGKDKLSQYHRRRDVVRSGEPAGPEATSDDPQFVVQRHDASSLHFDFRLQIGDVLVSWAAPKGPSLDPREKRLASRTDDHPLDYADFEGKDSLRRVRGRHRCRLGPLAVGEGG